MSATISFRDYLLKEKDFFIPNYQRGYVCGKKKKGDAKDSVTYMLESLLEGYKVKSEIFIQGVTVSETDSKIKIIDGQQRTTFFYLLLKCLGYKGKFVYIDIPENKATKVFSMMNGNKAEMKTEELIKAELLRIASLNKQDFEAKSEKEKNSIEWDNNLLRSRYAREWDKWLQWWNQKDVKCLFRTDNVMGLLIITFQKKMGNELSFTHFKADFLSGQKPIEAKRTFDGLRRLQKRFEDAYNSPAVYNKIGAIIRVGDKDSFIQWYFGGGNISMADLDQYYRLAFLRLTHKEILEELPLKQQKLESEAL